MQIRSFIKGASSGVLLLILLGCFTACEHELPVTQQSQPPAGLQATLSNIQTNIFTPKCVNAGCHPGGGAPMSLRSGDSFGTLVGVNSAYGKPRVAAGNANNSVLYLKVSGAAGVSSRMPLTGAYLSQAETDTIKAWINRGAQNN